MAGTAPPRLLETTAEIDCGWLEAVLAAGGHRATIASFALEPIGAGNVSDTARIVLEGAGAIPTSIVAKFRPADPGAHAHGIGSGAYVREAGAYRLFAAGGGGCRIPRLLWLAGSDDNINLVMEDLSRSTRSGDQIAGCSIADARAVTRELAKLHRTYRSDEATAPAWAIRMPEAGDYWVPVLERAVPMIAARFAHDLPARHIALVAAAARVSRTWHDLPHEVMAITHGDPRVDNVLFEERRAGDPGAILIDWQVTGVRNPMHDLSYFLSGSISIDDRRTAEHDLLALYADAFGDPAYGRGAIEADYRVQLVSGLMTTAAAVALLPDVAPVNRLLLTLLERNCAAVEDWGSVAALEQLA